MNTLFTENYMLVLLITKRYRILMHGHVFWLVVDMRIYSGHFSYKGLWQLIAIDQFGS